MECLFKKHLKGQIDMKTEIKPLTKADWEHGKLIRLVKPSDVDRQARLGVAWLAFLGFDDGNITCCTVESIGRARQLWPDVAKKEVANG